MTSLIAAFSLAFGLSAQPPQSVPVPKPSDFQGVWIGVAVVPEMGEDQLTLTLKVEKDACTGTLGDTIGLVASPDIREAKIDKARLTFTLDVANETGIVPVYLELTLERDALSGRWWNDDGETGAVRMARKPAL
jgi:hypothetical protein